MKLSDSTIEVLKNYAAINSNLLIPAGNTIRTISNDKSIFSSVELPETFPREVAIYNLSNLLNVLTLQKDQEIEFGEKSLTITNKSGGSFEYFYSEPGLVTTAPKVAISLTPTFEFTLNPSSISTLSKAAGIAAATMLSVVADGNQATLMVNDPNASKNAQHSNDTHSNSYRIPLCETDLVFDARIQIEFFKLVPPDEYLVVLSGERKLAHFKSNTRPLEYYVSLHRDSTF